MRAVERPEEEAGTGDERRLATMRAVKRPEKEAGNGQ
jgi:hypothetical protein